MIELHLGDCLTVLKNIPDNSIDSIVTDPPYGLSKQPDMADVLKHWIAGDDYEHKGGGFMGKKWDSFVPGPSVWRECLRVLKPGGHLLSFGGARTYDLMALAIRLAGFEVRDQLMWVYGSGFPKSLDVSKAIGDDTMSGWGTALKPAHEPIEMARKPLDGTVANNVVTHGTGAINIDGCRVKSSESDTEGRWPANFIHDGSDEVTSLFPAKAGALAPVKGTEPSSATQSVYGQINRQASNAFHGDTGSAARFFYCPKANPKDRNEGCDNLESQTASEMTGGRKEGSAGLNSPRAGAGRTSGAKNIHPTVKPTDLMRWLVRLVTPLGGVVLDLFTGSGSTGKAAVLEGMQFIGIEMEDEYIKIARDRIAHASGYPLVISGHIASDYDPDLDGPLNSDPEPDYDPDYDPDLDDL